MGPVGPGGNGQTGQTVQQIGQTVLKIGQNIAQLISFPILMGNLCNIVDGCQILSNLMSNKSQWLSKKVTFSVFCLILKTIFTYALRRTIIAGWKNSGFRQLFFSGPLPKPGNPEIQSEIEFIVS